MSDTFQVDPNLQYELKQLLSDCSCICNNNIIFNLMKKGVISFIDLKKRADWTGVTYLRQRKIFINLTKFKNYKNPLVLYQISDVILHEISHLLAAINPNKYFQTFSDVLITFYKVVWGQIVIPEHSSEIARKNILYSMQYEKRQAYAEEARTSFYKYVKKRKEYFYNDNMYYAILSLIKQFHYKSIVQPIFKNAYSVIYNCIPDSGFGQEILFPSEIICISTDCRTSKAINVQMRIIKLAKEIL